MNVRPTEAMHKRDHYHREALYSCLLQYPNPPSFLLRGRYVGGQAQ